MLWAVFECVQPWYLLLHPLVSFTLRQFSLDFVQLQFKAYASKLAFQGQEIFSVKSAPLWVALVCKGIPAWLGAACWASLLHKEDKLSRQDVLETHTQA